MSDPDKTPWGSLAVDEAQGLEVIKASYGLPASDPCIYGHRFIIAVDGTVAALVAGDMGYDFTHITIPRSDILALVEDWPEVTVEIKETDTEE